MSSKDHNPNTHEEKDSWSRALVDKYAKQYREYICQSYITELEHIDSYVEFMNYDLPHANDIWKRMVYNVKRQEKYEQSKRNNKNN